MDANLKIVEVDIKDYVDRIVSDLKEYLKINFELDRKAVEQYSKTNDEWKLLHNDLQRKIESDREKLVTKDSLDKAVIDLKKVDYVPREVFDRALETINAKTELNTKYIANQIGKGQLKEWIPWIIAALALAWAIFKSK